MEFMQHWLRSPNRGDAVCLDQGDRVPVYCVAVLRDLIQKDYVGAAGSVHKYPFPPGTAAGMTKRSFARASMVIK